MECIICILIITKVTTVITIRALTIAITPNTFTTIISRTNLRERFRSLRGKYRPFLALQLKRQKMLVYYEGFGQTPLPW